ncbi:MAG: peptide chain release factor N(5)-glutamine methyltransferase [Ginsengibacter sp.]
MHHKIIKFALMTIEQIYTDFINQLKSIYEEREAGNITDWIFESVAGLKRLERITNKQNSLDVSTIKLLNDKLEQLLQHKPVQYVLQEAWFYKMKFFVNNAVLIPRPETEELVEWGVYELKNKNEKVKIIDIGTGSGCIAIALKKELKGADILAIDISEDALAVAKRNALTLHANIQFLEIDFLDETIWHQLPLFDIIVSNPPYIPENDKIKMEKNVTDYEPHLALFVNDFDPFIFYRKIALFAQLHLNNPGKIYVEVQEEYADEVKKIFEQHGLSSLVKKDIYAKDRMVSARW